MKTLGLKRKIKTLIKSLPTTFPKQPILLNRYFFHCLER